jgi:hypothetical protein
MVGLPEEERNYIGSPLYKAAIRSAVGFSEGGNVDRKEYKRILKASKLACAEVGMLLHFAERSQERQSAEMRDLARQWKKEQQWVHASMNKMKSDD